MNEPSRRTDTYTSRLEADLEMLRAAIDDFVHALFGVNDEHWVEAFRSPLEVAGAFVALHEKRATATIADDAANLKSLFQRHHIPSEDAQLGVIETLTRLRKARAGLIGEIDALLSTAKLMGFEPRDPSFETPATSEFERAGLAGLLGGMKRRLDRVDAALDGLRPEGADQPGHTPQQIDLVNFFIDNVSVEVALAKLEATARTIVDFAGFARAIEAMSELTRDFVVTVRAMSDRLTQSLRAAAEGFRPVVGRVVRGLRTVVRYVLRNSPAEIDREPTHLSGLDSGDADRPAPQPRWTPAPMPASHQESKGSTLAVKEDRSLEVVQQVFDVSAVLAHEILGKAQIGDFRTGTRIVRRGDRISTLFIMISGLAHAVVYSLDGQTVLLHEYRRGDFFGVVSPPYDAIHDTDVVAVDDVTTILIDGADLAQLAERHGSVGLALLRVMVERLQHTASRMYEHVALSAVGRVHAELLRQARQSEDLTIRPSPLLSDLALRVSTTRETASRTLKALERRGIIRRDGNQLIVLSPKRLEELIV